MKITAKQIKEISEYLQAGMKVFINRKDLEIRTVLDWDDMLDDTGYWEEELEKIEREWTDYVTITKMESREVFHIMADFIDEIEDERLQENLTKILNRKSPFANFKDEIESSAYRQKWFDFKDRKYEEYVKEQLEYEGFEFE